MTFMVASRQIIENQNKITKNLEVLEDFLAANKLAKNKGTTKVTECMIQQKRTKTPGLPPSLNIINDKNEPETILDGKCCRILGANLSNYMTWKKHLESRPKALLPSLRKNIGSRKIWAGNYLGSAGGIGQGPSYKQTELLDMYLGWND